MNLHSDHEITRNCLVKQAATDKSHSSRGKKATVEIPFAFNQLEGPSQER